MSSIAVVSEYTPVEKALSVHAKNWAVKPKPQPLGVEQKVRGHVTVKKGSSFLTDKISTVTYDRADEALKAMHQETDRQLEAYRYPGQKDFTNTERQNSGGMWSRELVRRIQKLNRKLIVQDSKNAPGCAAFYKMVGDQFTYTNASFRHGFMPKYTLMKEDRAGLATEFNYGWTTVLLRLLKSGDLRWGAIVREFGFIEDDRSKQWAIETADFRI